MAKPPLKNSIYVVAGTNGAGKSSIIGAMLLEKGVEYFNPDVATKQILLANPEISQTESNAAAWNEGKRLLERAIRERLDFVFETTLGGSTITRLLEIALSRGVEVRVWYVGLSSAELHAARVRSRVKAGGHDVSEEKIRERFIQSRLNLIKLLPRLTELRLYDNSEDGDPATGKSPRPKLLLHCVQGKVSETCQLSHVPTWAKPIFAVALRLQ